MQSHLGVFRTRIKVITTTNLITRFGYS